MAVYVDKIVLTRNDIEEIHTIKAFFDVEFKIKDLGNLYYFLGIEVLYEPHSESKS